MSDDDLLRDAMRSHVDHLDAAADSSAMLDRLGQADRSMTIRKTTVAVVATATVAAVGVGYLAGQGGSNDHLLVQESPPSTQQTTTTSRPSATTTISVPPVDSAPAVPGGTGTPDADDPRPETTGSPSITSRTTTPPSALPPPPQATTTLPPATTTTTQMPPRCTDGGWLQFAWATVMPFDNKFSGSAVPGTIVTIDSPYGYGRTTADPGGHWEMWITINGMTKGQQVNIYANCQGNQIYWPFEYR